MANRCLGPLPARRWAGSLRAARAPGGEPSVIAHLAYHTVITARSCKSCGANWTMSETYHLNALPAGLMLQEYEVLGVVGAGSSASSPWPRASTWAISWQSRNTYSGNCPPGLRRPRSRRPRRRARRIFSGACRSSSRRPACCGSWATQSRTQTLSRCAAFFGAPRHRLDGHGLRAG
jgi:hypothetical protein